LSAHSPQQERLTCYMPFFARRAGGDADIRCGEYVRVSDAGDVTRSSAIDAADSISVYMAAIADRQVFVRHGGAGWPRGETSELHLVKGCRPPKMQ
jgi:hypothetical protein